jgi:quaternary ammonium compound-resistance protein SugE
LGGGSLGTVTLGVLLLGEAISVLKVCSVVMIVVGVAGLR